MNDLRHNFFRNKLEFTFKENEIEVNYKLKHIDYFKFEKLIMFITSKKYEENYDEFFDFINKIFIEIKITGDEIDEYKPSDLIFLTQLFCVNIKKELEILKKK